MIICKNDIPTIAKFQDARLRAVSCERPPPRHVATTRSRRSLFSRKAMQQNEIESSTSARRGRYAKLTSNVFHSPTVEGVSMGKYQVEGRGQSKESTTV